MKIDKHTLMDTVGKALFFTSYPKTLIKSTFPDNRYSKFDLIVEEKGVDKYIEIKTMRDCYNSYYEQIITKSDFDYLVYSTPKNSKSLLYCVDNNYTIVYDLKAIAEANTYTTKVQGNYKDEMQKTGYKNEEMVFLNYSENKKAGHLSFKNVGAIKMLDINVVELLNNLQSNKITEVI
ncbi:hypothetical protein L950_0221625 [Sphingobacterium sp. IITKGP-BTPF85]|nr:hypothetical protein L950_0221625 [Sphingobacterium sp. IITKGP-BTPF85]